MAAIGDNDLIVYTVMGGHFDRKRGASNSRKTDDVYIVLSGTIMGCEGSDAESAIKLPMMTYSHKS